VRNRPILCNYYVTYRCNAKCGFCDIWEQPSPLVDLADVEVNLDHLKTLGVRVVDFTGGEPLLHPEIGTILRMAKKRGFITTLTSNGLLYPKRSRAIQGLVDLLHFSIDSPYRHEHDSSRGVECYDRLIESVRLAVSLGERPDLLFTVTPDSHHHLERIYRDIARPNGLILIANPLFAYNDRGGHLAAEALGEMRRFAKQKYVYLNPAFLTLRDNGGNRPEDPDCRAVSTTVVISPHNELVLPCYHAGLEKLPIGGDLFSLWHSSRVQWHRSMEGRHEVCRGCTINCYFEPSFATDPSSSYFWESLPSKVRYAWTKFVIQRVSARFGDNAVVMPQYAEPLPPPAGDGQPPGPESLLEALPVLR
jgi:MoaA/NifB/PqqE/SkfB family radical SAM enzyme